MREPYEARRTTSSLAKRCFKRRAIGEWRPAVVQLRPTMLRVQIRPAAPERSAASRSDRWSSRLNASACAPIHWWPPPVCNSVGKPFTAPARLAPAGRPPSVQHRPGGARPSRVAPSAQFLIHEAGPRQPLLLPAAPPRQPSQHANLPCRLDPGQRQVPPRHRSACRSDHRAGHVALSPLLLRRSRSAVNRTISCWRSRCSASLRLRSSTSSMTCGQST